MALAMSKKEASLLKRIRGLLPGTDADAYLVGGYIRDTLLGRKTRDIDIAVGASATGGGPGRWPRRLTATTCCWTRLKA